MEKIDYKTLKGEDLYTYFLTDHPDREYGRTVALLPVATGWDSAKAFNILERSVAEDKQLVAIYESYDGNIDTSDMEYIGPIDDGALYLV